MGSLTADPPASVTASRTRGMESAAAPDDTGAWKSTPPLNSIEKFSPRRNTAPIATRTTTAEMKYHSRRRPTKLIDSSPV